jgi:LPS export ABC transporter protein LptC
MKGKNALLLTGHTEVELENGTNLKTDTLYWDGNKNEFTTDDFVVIKGENFLVTGTGMIFKSGPQDIELKTNVSATID